MTDNNDSQPPVNVSPILAQDEAAALQHLKLLFGRAHQGKIELTHIHTGGGIVSRVFELGEEEEGVALALRKNREPGWNAYVGAALRHPDTFPGGVASDEHFFRSYALWADADSEAQVLSAQKACREAGLMPPLVVITGMIPERRLQLWWPLETPIDSIDVLRRQLRGIAVALGTDPKVCTGKQLMRLAGSLAWPKPDKPGRVLEQVRIYQPAAAVQEFPLEQIERIWAPSERFESGVATDIVVAPAGSLGLDEKVMDGRETYAFRLVRATLREWISTRDTIPTPDSLYLEVAPTYLARADQSRPGRGPEFLKTKVVEALRAFHAGQIPGMKTVDEARETWAEHHPTVEDDDPDDEPVTSSSLHGEPPPRRWIVPDWIAQGAVNSLYGDGGLGKTLLAQQLACSASLGARWLGLETTKSRTLAVLCEDDLGELHRRHNDIKAALGYGVGNPFDDALLWPRIGRDNLLMHWGSAKAASPGPFLEKLEQRLDRLEPSLLILDTLADFYGGLELDRLQVNYFVKAILGGMIRRRPGLTILLLGHPSVRGMESDAGFSGSTAWNNAVRSRLYLTRPKDGAQGDRMLTRGKANYSASGAETGLRLTYESGVFRLVEEVDEGDPILWAAKQEVIKRTAAAWRSDAPLSALKTHPRAIAKVLLPALCNDGFRRDVALQAITACVEDGLIYVSRAHGKRGFRAGSTRDYD